MTAARKRGLAAGSGTYTTIGGKAAFNVPGNATGYRLSTPSYIPDATSDYTLEFWVYWDGTGDSWSGGSILKASAPKHVRTASS